MEKKQAARPCSVYLRTPVLSKISDAGSQDHVHDDHNCAAADVVGSRLVSYGTASMQGWRSHMEDAHITLLPNTTTSLVDGSAVSPQCSRRTMASVQPQCNFEPRRRPAEMLRNYIRQFGALFAVFDGHEGNAASRFCAQHLLDCILLACDRADEIMERIICRRQLSAQRSEEGSKSLVVLKERNFAVGSGRRVRRVSAKPKSPLITSSTFLEAVLEVDEEQQLSTKEDAENSEAEEDLMCYETLSEAAAAAASEQRQQCCGQRPLVVRDADSEANALTPLLPPVDASLSSPLPCVTALSDYEIVEFMRYILVDAFLKVSGLCFRKLQFFV